MAMGLTCVINERSEIYMEKYLLQDEKHVIDGSCISQRLYFAHFQPENGYFNVDYDRYADLVRCFFKALIDCNIKPYILINGSYEWNKTNRRQTLLYRMQTNIDSVASNKFEAIFPLSVVDSFINIAKEFNIKVICCIYENDKECAKLANDLNCPVLSYDSRFYIFDVMYIPFKTLNLKPITRLKTKNNKKAFKYLSCEIFKRDNFLKDTGLSEDVLPIYSVLLGNNYIRRENFQVFFDTLFGSMRFGAENLAEYYSNKTKDCVIQELLTIYNSTEEQHKVDIVFNSMNDYIINPEERSKYLKYFESDCVVNDDVEDFVDSSGSSPEISSLFIRNFKQCLYPTYFLTIFFNNIYFTVPLLEDYNKASTVLLCSEIISAIHKILRPCSAPLQLYIRKELLYKGCVVDPCTVEVPVFMDIPNIDLKSRQQILLKILDIEESFIDCLDDFPDTWKLYIITIKYLCTKSSVLSSLIYSLLLCKIVINYVDVKLAKFIRDPEDDIFQTAIAERAYPDLKNTIRESIEDITYEDSLLALKNVINYFVFQSESNNFELLGNIIHHTAEFQNCLYHINSLNSLLNLPFENCPIHSCFNGTFLYSLTNELRQYTKDYIDDLLRDSPTVLNCFNLMITKLKMFIYNKL